MNIRHLIRKEVATLKPYAAGEVACRVKLDANESPYGFGEALEAAAAVATNRYPDPEAKALRKALAGICRVSPDQILLGNGSDELIYYLIAAFGGPVLYPVPTFSMYGIIGRAFGEKTVEVPLDDALDLPLRRMTAAIREQRPKLVFLSSPNNPTGNRFSDDRIRRIIALQKAIIVVDEAYQPFAGGDGFLPALQEFPHLVIMRTLSKIGLAALRLGFLVASPEVIEVVNRVRLPFNVNALSQAVARQALARRAVLDRAIRRIAAGRNRLMREMGGISGVRPYPSDANFILFRVEDANSVHASLLRQGVLVRNLDSVMNGCLRVTVGTPGENAAFLKALKTACGEAN